MLSPPKNDYLKNYQTAKCSDKTTRYCVKAKVSQSLWWIAFDPTQPLPTGAEDPGKAKCDKARVGSDLKGGFIVTPNIKCAVNVK